jgi:hypothetical protein
MRSDGITLKPNEFCARTLRSICTPGVSPVAAPVVVIIPVAASVHERSKVSYF